MKHSSGKNMKHFIMILATVMALAASQASAGCTAEYKAKRDNPLRLDYGTVSVPDSACTKAAATPIVRSQLAQRGWTLLSILSVRSGG